MSVKLLTEHHLEFVCLKGGCTASSESTLVNLNVTLMESHVAAHPGHIINLFTCQCNPQVTFVTVWTKIRFDKTQGRVQDFRKGIHMSQGWGSFY